MKARHSHTRTRAMRQRGYIVCLSFILLMIAAHTVQAQSLANYVISQTGSITFNTISSSGNPIPSWRNSTQWIEDDNRSYPIPIGFDFWYNGTRYTEVSIGINGFLDFSSSTADGTIGVAQSGQDYDSDNPSHNRLSNTTGFKAWNALAPVYGDMSTQDQLDPLGASFKYLTSGVAPNRVFTTEWINLSVWDQIQTGTSYNFQVKLYETSGIIEFVYGTMTNGLATLQYKCGINAADLSGGLSAAVLRIQQTANSTNFLPQSIPTTGYTTTLPTSNSKLAFTPTIPTAPSALSFTSVTTSSMTVNWTDNATGEFGYALYRSNDGVNYSYIRQLVANTDSSSETGLAAGVTYYWKVFALSEGGLSGAGSGSQVTLAGSIPVSFQSGNWSSPSTWVGNAVPAPTDNIVISSGHIVSVDQNVTANKLTINGTLRIGNSTTARSLTIADSVKINSGGTLDVNTAFTQSGHSIILSGDILNNGTLDLGPNANSRCSITFNKLGNQTIGGSGSLTRFYLITLNMGSSSDNILDVFSTNFTTQTTGFLTLTNGTFRFSSPNTITPFTASTTIPTTGQLWLNHSSAVVTTTGGNITLSGPLRITNGTLNIGSVADNNLISNGGQLWIENGAVNVAGRFEEINSVTISRFKMNGGTMTVNTVGSTSAVNAPFNISVAGATFTMTGGTIVIQRAGTGNLGYKNIGSLTTTVTGGTLQMGNASTPNATTMTVNSTIPVYNFDIRNGVGTNAAQLLTNALTVKNNVIITSGTFDANGLEMTVGGNWSNAGTFTSGAGKVTFNGTTAQSVTKASVETFNKLAINTTSTTVTMNASITVNDSFQLTSGTVSIGANTLTLDGIVTSSGTLLSGTTGTVIYNRGAAAQNVLAAEYGNLTFSNFTKVLPASLMTIAGTFTPGTAAGHTVTGNTIELNSAGPQTISSFQYNNIILSGSGVKTLEAGADTALGSLSINSGVTLADNGVTLVVLGNLSNDGAHTGAGKISLSGSTQQTVSGAGTITNLQMNNAAGALMSGPKTIEGVLTLTNGVIVTNTDTMTISATGSVSRTSGHIFGWLRKNISAGSNVSVAFELGDTTNYTPAQFVFSTVSNAGTMSATTVSAEHPNIITSYINVADDVNRYWDTRRSNFEFTGTYSLTLTFVAADCEISGKTTFKMNVFDGSAWTSEVSGTNTTTTNQATGILVLGAYAVGLQDASGAYRTKASGEWNNFAVVWEKFNGTTWIAATTSPVLADGQITIRNGHIVTVSTSHTGGASGLDQILIETGGNLTVTTGGTFQIRNGAGVDLTVYGDLVWQGGLITANGTPVLEFLSGSKYNHKLNANAIVSGSAYTATWDPNSTIEVTGVTTTAPTKLNQAIGNLTWNCVSQTAAVSFTTNLTNVTGSLTVHATGTGKVILTTTNTTLSVQKNIVITGGSVCFKSGATNSLNVNNVDTLSISGGYVTLDSLSTATTARINVADYFSMTNGTLNFNSVNNLVNGGTIYIAGNYSVTGGSLLNVGTGTASGSIVFNGTQRQTITSGATVTGNIDYTINTGAWLALGTSTVTGRNFTLSASTTFEIGSPNGISSAGATGNIQSTGTRSFGNANYIYNGSVVQSTGNGLPATINKLTIQNIAGVNQTTASVTVSDSIKLLSGVYGVGTNSLIMNSVVYVTSGSFSSSATGLINYNQSSNGQNVIAGTYGNITFSNFNKNVPSGTIEISGTFTPGSATGHTTSGSTFNFSLAGEQTIPTWSYYHHLSATGSNWKKIDGNVLVNGNLTVSGATLSDSIYTMTVYGDITNSSRITSNGGGSTIITGGTQAHVFSGGGTYTDVQLNDVYGASLSGNITIDNILTLTNGIVATGTDSVLCNTAAGISRPSNGGHINGFLRKNIEVNATSQNYTFEIGDAANYTPVEITFASVTVGGTLTIHQAAVEHTHIKYSGINRDLNVNRHFTLVGNGISYSTYGATFYFVVSDIDAGANTAFFFIKQRPTTLWKTTSINNRTATSTRITNVTGFGDFVIGELSNIFYWTNGAGTMNWGDGDNWSANNIPTSGNDVVFDEDDTIEVNVAALCNNFTLHNDTARVTILSGNSITVTGTFNQYSGIFSTQTSFPAVTGAITLSGGTVGYDGNGAQTISDPLYYNLRLSGGGTKSAVADLTINQNLIIGTGTSFDDAGSFISVGDSITNNGSHIGTGRIYLYGSSQHQLNGAGSFTNVELDNTSNGVVLDSTLTINGILTLTSGIISAPNDTLNISGTGSIVRTSGHINGNLRKYFGPSADSLSFEIGTASSYLPITVSFGTITTGGNLTVQMISGDHPNIIDAGINLDSTINRYWVLNNNGIIFNAYNITLNWLPADVDAGINNYSDLLIVKNSNGTWSDIVPGVVTATSIRGMNATSFSAIGIGKGVYEIFTSVATGNWNTAATWDLNRVPKKRDKVIIVSPYIVTLVDDREISNVTINSGAELADGGNTLDMYGRFDFNGKWSGTGRIRWNDFDQDTLSGLGGTATGTSTLMLSGSGKLITATNDTLYRLQIGSGNSITNNGTVRITELVGDAAGSTWTNNSGASLNVADTLLSVGTLVSTSTNNTVIYNGTGNQTVKQTNYFHLTISGSRGTNSITLPNSSIAVTGTFTPSATFTSGSFIKTGNTIDYAGSGAQTITAFDYNNLTISSAHGGATVTFAGSDTVGIAGTLSMTATSVSYSVTGSVIDYNGTGSQTISAFNYYALRISGARTTNSVTLASSDTIGVADSLCIVTTFTSGGFITTGSKIAYNGTGSQTVVPFDYNNLSISGARGVNNVVFAPTDTVKIEGVLAVSSSFGGGALFFTGSNVEFNGTGAQTIPSFNYHTLKSSGARTTNTVTLSSGTIGIANSFVPAAVFTSGDYNITSNTINFNGAGAQTIPSFRYNHLATATGGTKSANGTLRVAGDLTIGSGSTLNAGSTTDTIYGNWTTVGVFTPSTSTIVFAGSNAASITGVTSFATLTMNKVDSATAVSLVDDISADNLVMTKGTLQTGAKSITITNTRTGNGIVIGTVTRTHSFALSTAYAFEGPNSTIAFTAGTTPSSVTMTVSQTAPSSPTFVAVNRAVNIAVTGGSGLTSTVRLHYENSEANNLNETIMKLWQYSGSWLNRNSSLYDSVENYIEMSGLTSTIAGNWGIGSSASTKTVSDINGGTATAGDSILYTISITNPYNVTKNSILVTDPLDNNLILKSGSISNIGGIAGQTNNGNGSLVGGTITWPGFSLASGASTSRTFKANTDSLMNVSEAIDNTAAIDFGGSNIENVFVSLTITNVANIIIDTNIVSHQAPVPGDTLIYTLKYRNIGTSNATSVTTTYTIPGNTTFVINGYGALSGTEVNGVAKTNVLDLDEVTVSGSTITIEIPMLSPGAYNLVKFKTIVN